MLQYHIFPVDKHLLLSLGLVLLMFALGGFFYESLPDKVASHWNASGEVDGYMDKGWFLYSIPAMTAVLLAFFLLIPGIDPLRRNIAKFRGEYNRFILVFNLFMLYIFCATIALNLGYKFDMGSAILPAVGGLIIYAGFLMEKSKRNWFIGVRTPWTLSSDAVWDKTNRLGGRVFRACGLIMVLGAFLPGPLAYLAVAPLLVSALGLVAYSYMEYRKLGETK